LSNFPDDLKYANSHEWVRMDDDGMAIIGISNHAQEALGDIVFVELPELETVADVKDEIAVVESVKAASDVYAPISGEVIAINDTLIETPETVNTDPYGEGWFFKLKPSDLSELDELLDADSYQEFCNEE
jgi:glycine cleavage system H protein